MLGAVYALSLRLGGRPAANWHRDDNNFGDQMAPFLLQSATGTKPMWVPGWYPGKVLGLGSLIHRIQQGDVVWGTGAINDAPLNLPPRTRILAVRGPLTRRLLGADVPEVYGDPGLLLPRFYDEHQEPIYEIGVIPHFLDKTAMQLPHDPAVLMIDVQADWRTVVDNIRRCRSILSSSLHGLVVADSYGIPARWVSVGDRSGGPFKFHDYYLGTGREPPPPLVWNGRLPRQWPALPPLQMELEQLLSAAQSIVS